MDKVENKKKPLRGFIIFQVVSFFATLYMIYLWIFLADVMYAVSVFINLSLMLNIALLHFSYYARVGWQAEIINQIFIFFMNGALIIFFGYLAPRYNLINIMFGVALLLFDMAFAYYYFFSGKNGGIPNKNIFIK
jgi:hypothetical protein